MPISITYSIAIIAVTIVCTLITRILPFAIFGGNRKMPKSIQYLGDVLPPAIIATLVIYCLKEVDFLQFPKGVAEILSIALVTGLHIWKRNTLLSIGLGTVFYMILIRII